MCLPTNVRERREGALADGDAGHRRIGATNSPANTRRRPARSSLQRGSLQNEPETIDEMEREIESLKKEQQRLLQQCHDIESEQMSPTEQQDRIDQIWKLSLRLKTRLETIERVFNMTS